MEPTRVLTGPTVTELFFESQDMHIASIRWHTRMRTHLYVNEPHYEWDFPVDLSYKVRFTFPFQFAFSE